MIKNVLSIAGSDPSGGAGIQADLKTFSALGCYGMAAITALTAQNTQGVSGVYEVPHQFVAQQIKAIFEDIDVHAVKIGMVGSVKTIKVIAQLLQHYKPQHIVLDPVMVAQSGDRLISNASVKAMKKYLIPIATIITPNLPEADVLGSRDPQELLKLGAKAVFLKGGHEDGAESVDVFANASGTFQLAAPRVQTNNNHGTGCTLASAIAAYLAKGASVEDAVRNAKFYVTDALKAAEKLNVGKGHGPVHHFHENF